MRLLNMNIEEEPLFPTVHSGFLQNKKDIQTDVFFICIYPTL